MSCSCSTSEDFVVINSSCQIGSNSFLLVESNPVCVHVSMCMRAAQCVQLFATPLTVANQAPLSMEILQARILEGVGCHFLTPRVLPDPGIEPVSPDLAGGFFTTVPLGKPQIMCT